MKENSIITAIRHSVRCPRCFRCLSWNRIGCFTSRNYRAPRCHRQGQVPLRCLDELPVQRQAAAVSTMWPCHVDCWPRSVEWWERTVGVKGAIPAAPYIKPACASWHGSDRARSASTGCSTRTNTRFVHYRSPV